MAKLDNLIARCLGELEANGGDVEACLRSHPEQADELRPFLILWAGLPRDAATAPQPAALSAGREQLVKAAIDARNARKESGLMWKNPVYRLATAIGGSLLLGVAALGIAGATGGGGAAGDVLQTLRLTSSSGESAVASTTPTPAPTPTPALTPTPAATPSLEVPNGSATPTPSNGPSESPGGSPGPRTAATNPDGHCVMLPDTSDVIRQPDKHPGWHVVGGACPSASATSSATATPTPTPTPTPSASGTQGNSGSEQKGGHANGGGHGQNDVN